MYIGIILEDRSPCEVDMISVRQIVACFLGVGVVLGIWLYVDQTESVLSGTVVLDGKPIRKGRLILTPDEEQGNTGSRIMCDIENGSFRFHADDDVTSGPHVAVVTVHPKKASDGSVTMLQLARMPLFMVDVSIPDEPTDDLLIEVFKDKFKNKKIGRYRQPSDDALGDADEEADDTGTQEGRASEESGMKPGNAVTEAGEVGKPDSNGDQ